MPHTIGIVSETVVEITPRTPLAGMVYRHRLGLPTEGDQAGVIIRPFLWRGHPEEAFFERYPPARGSSTLINRHIHAPVLREFFRKGELVYQPSQDSPHYSDPHVGVELPPWRWQALILLLRAGFNIYTAYQDQFDPKERA